MTVWKLWTLVAALSGMMALTSLTGCSTTAPATEQLAERAYYQQAQQAIRKENFLVAIDRLQALESRYPFGDFAAQARLDLIYCHYRTLDYEAAAATADRFLRAHQGHSQTDYALYMKGLASYSVDRGLLERFIPSDFTERDMGPTRQSFEDFAELLRRFPASQYAVDAHQRMVYLRNLMAAYEIRVGRFYLRRGAYTAAAARAHQVITQFPSAPAVADALVVMADAYQALALTQLRDDSIQLLKLNFPAHERFDQNGEFQFQRGQQQRPSLLHVISFGLLG